MNKFKKNRVNKQGKLSQRQFADLLGTTETSINRYENDKRTPKKSTILLMTFSADALRFAEQKAKKDGLL